MMREIETLELGTRFKDLRMKRTKAGKGFKECGGRGVEPRYSLIGLCGVRYVR